jgi:predicted SAM-dependent methyltransferase
MFYHQCNYCHTKSVRFNSLEDNLGKQLADYKFPYKLKDFETLSYKTYQCPHCWSADRDRLYKLYIEKYIDLSKPIKILEFAPAEPIKNWLTSHTNVEYRSADLYMDNVDDKIDITDMKEYDDNSFDFIICSHILEHVESDAKALSELHRILKPGGKGIIMAPIITREGAFDEDANETDVSERWRRFAQDDHVRIYDREVFMNKLKEADFKVNVYGFNKLGALNFIKCGIDFKSRLYIVTKE